MTLVIHLVGIHSCLPCSKTVCWGNTGEFNTRVHMFSPTLTLTLTLLLTDNKHDTGSLQKLLTIHLQCEVALSFVYLNTLHHQLCMSRKTCFFFFFSRQYDYGKKRTRKVTGKICDPRCSTLLSVHTPGGTEEF